CEELCRQVRGRARILRLEGSMQRLTGWLPESPRLTRGREWRAWRAWRVWSPMLQAMLQGDKLGACPSCPPHGESELYGQAVRPPRAHPQARHAVLWLHLGRGRVVLRQLVLPPRRDAGAPAVRPLGSATLLARPPRCPGCPGGTLLFL